MRKVDSWYYDVGCVREEKTDESKRKLREIIDEINKKILEENKNG